MPQPICWTFVDGAWHEGSPAVMGPLTHAMWQASVIFDGARAYDGLVPDLARHCARSIDSARKMGLAPRETAEEIEALAREGVRRHEPGAALYIRPMFWAESGIGALQPDPDSTRFLIAVYEAPMPPGTGMTAVLSRFRRPAPDMAPTDAKAACLYPNSARAIAEAREKGADNAVVLDHTGAVAEFATANLFFVKNGVVITPATNGSFLNGITRQRVIDLLRAGGHTVEERRVEYAELLDADELFSTGNYGKVQPFLALDDRRFQAGPVCLAARDAYRAFAETQPL
ncbi:MAG: branched-chain amino acid aminotransferase [Alphaproteobacteria bacterium]|nr:branched-chain amino acid aminotransferase [Alphaproteobacteria bacterium]